MSLEVSKKVSQINPSATLGMVNKIAELKKEGKEIIAFNVGEPDFATPQHISAALIAAINEGKTKYVSVSGILELREAICQKLKKDNNLEYSPQQIIVSTGAKQSLYNAVSAITNEGDEIIIPTPCWVSYEEMVKVNGAKCVFVPTNETDFQLDLKAISQAITAKTKAIIINSPNNPTGAVYSQESLEQLAALAIQHQFYVIADEIYEKLVYDGQKPVSIASLNKAIYEQTITINGFAKAYAMTGHRLGYAAMPQSLATIINNLQAHMTSNSTTPVQYAGVAALESSQECVSEMANEFDQRRLLSFDLLDDIPLIKYNKVTGAFYIMIDISAFIGKQYQDYQINNADDMSLFLLEYAQIALVSGKSFQAPNFLRFSYSTSQDNIKNGLKAMKAALNLLK
ncbi:pyridoxal phosphate-dependent aminotransferase [Erysipelotrichaceae bacterium OttesenSCG-928-M19]|nr:pyridoxal phosphate-dependent aminotransferase [Erysipelotrichaceae bacterium OttesenSCG-928-M19]